MTLSPRHLGTPMWLGLAAFVGLVTALTLFAASGGIRGSDQYWYVTEVESLIRDGANATNVVLPVGLLGDGSGLPPPFIHNVLGVYLAAIPALVVGAPGGWVVLNLLATLGTSWLIYRTARLVADHWAALACAVLYPFLPLVSWHAAQPLAEPSVGFLAALAVYCLATSGSDTRRWLVLVGALGLLYAARQSYLPLLLAAPLAFLVIQLREGARPFRGVLGATALVLGTAVLIAALVNTLLGRENVQFTYTRLWHTAVPDRTDNMWFNFDLSNANLTDSLPFDLGLLGPKLVGHLGQQLVSFDSVPIAVFYWTFNILALVTILKLLFERDPPRVRLLLAGLAFIAVHLVTIVLFQNQFRYGVPAIPVLLVSFAMVLSDNRSLSRRLSPRPVALVLTLCVLGLAPGVVLGRMLRDEGATYSMQEAAAGALFDRHVASDEPAWLAYEGTPQLMTYAARPRLVLQVVPTYTLDEFRRLMTAFPARWIVAPSDSKVLAILGLDDDVPVDDVDALGSRWELHDLGASRLGPAAQTVP